jgi:hypothetical protein
VLAIGAAWVKLVMKRPLLRAEGLG